jgi:hypothetical protein
MVPNIAALNRLHGAADMIQCQLRGTGENQPAPRVASHFGRRIPRGGWYLSSLGFVENHLLETK